MERIRDKRSFRQSPTTTWREREPTSPRLSDAGNPSMVIDFSKQSKIVPGIGTPTRHGHPPYRTMNKSGEPKALNTMVGGSADPPSDVFGAFGKRPPPRKVKGY